MACRQEKEAHRPDGGFQTGQCASACVPQVICGRTRQASVWNVSAYTCSSVSRPKSLYPYPEEDCETVCTYMVFLHCDGVPSSDCTLQTSSNFCKTFFQRCFDLLYRSHILLRRYQAVHIISFMVIFLPFCICRLSRQDPCFFAVQLSHVCQGSPLRSQSNCIFIYPGYIAVLSETR